MRTVNLLRKQKECKQPTKTIGRNEQENDTGKKPTRILWQFGFKKDGEIER